MGNGGGARRGFAPQPEFRLVATDASWAPPDPEIPAPDDGRDPLAGLSLADLLTKRWDRIA